MEGQSIKNVKDSKMLMAFLLALRPHHNYSRNFRRALCEVADPYMVSVFFDYYIEIHSKQDALKRFYLPWFCKHRFAANYMEFDEKVFKELHMPLF
jgi:hypothetical protein